MKDGGFTPTPAAAFFPLIFLGELVLLVPVAFPYDETRFNARILAPENENEFL